MEHCANGAEIQTAEERAPDVYVGAGDVAVYADCGTNADKNCRHRKVHVQCPVRESSANYDPDDEGGTASSRKDAKNDKRVNRPVPEREGPEHGDDTSRPKDRCG